jgi:hypothetical protein
MTKEIFQPTGKEKVAQIPEEWQQLQITNNGE